MSDRGYDDGGTTAFTRFNGGMNAGMGAYRAGDDGPPDPVRSRNTSEHWPFDSEEGGVVVSRGRYAACVRAGHEVERTWVGSVLVHACWDEACEDRANAARRAGT